MAFTSTKVLFPHSRRRWDLAGALLALLVVLMVLIGWALEIRLLRSFFPQFIDMKLSTAVGVGAFATSVICFAARSNRLASRWSAWLAMFVAALGFVTLVEYAVGPGLLITDWTYKGGRLYLDFKERLAPITAYAFCFAGAGMLLLRRDVHVALAQVLLVLTGEIGLVTITAYLYGASSFYGETPEHQMALTTAIGLIGASVGGLFLRPDHGLVRAFLARDAGGRMARQLVPAAIILIIFLGWLRLQAEGAGLFNVHTATALYALSCVTILALLIYRSASDISMADAKRRRAERELRSHKQNLELEVQQRTAELQISEARFRQVTELMSDVVLEADLSGGTIQWIGPIDEIMGVAEAACPADLNGLLDSIHKEDREQIETVVDNAQRQPGQQLLFEFRLLRADGMPLHFSAQGISLLDESGPRLLLALTNVTATRRAEEQGRRLESQMRQMQKMEAIGTLAGGIAHDFNNILAAIMGYGEMVRAELPRGSEIRENQDEVMTAARRASELVKQILTFSRHNLTARAPVAMKSIVKEVAKLMRASLPSTIEIRCRIDTEDTTVLADPIQLHQVLMNLCTNAGHAMSKLGGVLELRVRPYEVELDSGDSLHPGHYLLVSVSDTGVGIPPENLERIFEPFFTTKDVGEGTGLGLSTAHGIISELGGRISVYSELGEGTTLHVYLPLVQGEVREEIPHEALRGTERILFVDDEMPLARLGKIQLEQYGYTVETYSNSVEALKAFCDNPTAYDLVVTDQTMPRLKGIELAARIAQISPDTPVILCTGFGLQERSTTVEAIREVLIKPVDRAELTQAIRRTLEHAHTD